MGKSLVVIGGTAAGLSAASKAKRNMPDLEVTVYEKSGYVSYGSCGLPYFVGDLIKDPLDLVSLTVEQLTKSRDIQTLIYHEVTKIDRTEKTVSVTDLKSGKQTVKAYDYLVIATGASPIMPPVKGIHGAGVHVIRNVEDGIALKQRIQKKAKRAVVIGGGYIGLEMAEQFALSGIQVTLLEALPRLLPFLQAEFADSVCRTLEKNGISVHTGCYATEILRQDDCVIGVKASDGLSYDADFVLVSVGVHPNSALAYDAGLPIGYKDGIIVDDTMQTADPSIWACGDCVQMKNRMTGEPCYIPLGTTANKQGRIAGGNISGEKESFPGVLGSQVTKLFDLYVASTGLTEEQAKEAGFETATCKITKGDRASYYPGSNDSHLYLVFDKQSGQILGAQGVGGNSIAGRINVFVTAITCKMTVLEVNELDLVYAPPVAPVYDPILIAASQAIKMVDKS